MPIKLKKFEAIVFASQSLRQEDIAASNVPGVEHLMLRDYDRHIL